ncbi:hypothetical protein SUGI_1061450 [Cryptomeria japonica]|uniref:putative transcription elongation factor SPT5 homolog 1 n=1 Tax=Cryptomeria japonica TaxID=3369 RepID=UPI00241482C7|nr:putative transcription elongation factor SPT5 homolog 1 [Cryptomeria japonica]GLJ49926.1 hypothetical protein SUGI_1061450 [Cryptomeria japonica]
MPSRYADDDDNDEEQQFGGEEEEDEQVEEEEDDYGNEMEQYDEVAGSSRKRSHRRSAFIDDVADEEDDDEEEEDDDEEEEDDEYVNPRKKKMRRASAFIDDTADVASDDEEEEEGEEEDYGFINDTDAQVDEFGTRPNRHTRVEIEEKEDDEEDLEDLERQIHERYAAHREQEEDGDEEIGQVEQQANLASVTDPKLWMVKCAQGFEREAACCLMQKYLDLMAQGTDLQILSAVALDHLKGYLYIEAHKDAYVRQACKGMRNIYSQTVKLVPIKEMPDVLTVHVKQMGLGKETWVRVKSGIYKGDLAKAVELDNVRQRVTLKLVPRLDFQALKRRMEGSVSKEEKKKAAKIVPPARFVNLRQITDMGIVVERKRDSVTGEMFETVENMMFKDGYLYKTMSIKSVNSQNIKPSFDELQKFQSSNAESDMAAADGGRKKQMHFRKGDMVVVMRGDLKNLKGCVERVDDENIHVRTKMEGIEGTVLSFHQNELCKFFETGDHVKVVSGTHEGTTGMIVKLERNNVLIIIADRTREDIKVFADNVVECKEEASGVIKLGEYQLHDFVQLDRNSFGVIISVENDGFQILKAVPERTEVVGVKLRDIGRKIFDRNFKANDQYRNTVGLKDVMKILEGPFKGKQGPIEHINRGIVFIRDPHCLENGGFICARAASCVAVGGMHHQTQSVNPNTFTTFRSFGASQYGNRPMRGRYGGRGRERQDPLVGKMVKIRLGGYKGYRGRVLGVEGHNVRIELESQMKVVTVSRDHLIDPFMDTTNTNHGNETPMHRLQTPMRPYMIPSCDSGFDPLATPMRDGMRTPVIDRAWNANENGTPSRHYS